MKSNRSRAPSPTGTTFSGISNYRSESYRRMVDKDMPPVSPIDYRAISEVHFNELDRYLQAYLAKTPANSRSSARQKLTRLTIQQFHELSTDVYDELVRRKNEKEGRYPEFKEEPSGLVTPGSNYNDLPVSDFPNASPPRNNGRTSADRPGDSGYGTLNLLLTEVFKLVQKLGGWPTRIKNSAIPGGLGTKRKIEQHYRKAVEAYCLYVLPKLEQWEYASEFLDYESELTPDTRESFKTSLRTLHAQAIAARLPRVQPPRAHSPAPSSSSSSSSLSSTTSMHTVVPATPRPRTTSTSASTVTPRARASPALSSLPSTSASPPRALTTAPIPRPPPAPPPAKLRERARPDDLCPPPRRSRPIPLLQT
ncbi:hypothetical protein MSAN_00005200 [Mycena sanguinolenta]|uniref:GIT Spa2 homology (SHD) domain-containing protein n=1 Tax=Mycena sanguinolenta TaxID=230812 RepID=A0A8H6ZBI9_9AGAR|nr:hypothetical protein MSAN_00005200 [Mycena sanguinolenta]